jgi:hypothetical protein
MDRTLYTDGQEVTQRQLRRTEDTRVFHVLDRFTALAQLGVRSGLEVTVNPVNSTIVDLSAGFGYAPNGELIELSAAIEGISINATSGSVIGLVYTEIESAPAAHELDGTSSNTKAARAVRLAVLTPTEYDALNSSEADFALDALDRFLIAAFVTVEANSGALIIESPATFADFIVTINATVLPGIVITAIDPTTPKTDPAPLPGGLSFATLSFDPSTTSLTYTAPTDTAGASQNIISGGSFTISSNSGYTITVEVVPALLPTSGPTLTDDDLIVDHIYATIAPRATAEDGAHRNLLGGQVPTPENPHGLRVSDIATLYELFPGTIELGGALNEASVVGASQTPRLITRNSDLSGGASSTFTFIWEMPGTGISGGPFTIRWYMNNFDTLVLTVNAVWDEASSQWARDTVANSSLRLDFASAGFVLYQHASTEPDLWADGAWNVNEFHSTLSNRTQFTGNIELGLLKLAEISEVETSRIQTHYSKFVGRTRTLIWESRGVTSVSGLSPVFDTGESYMAIYRVSGADGIFTSDTDGLEIVRNATWRESTADWDRVGSGAATKLLLTRTRVAMLRHDDPPPWDDTAWTSTDPYLTFGPAGPGSLVLGGTITAGDTITAPDYDYAPARTFYHTVGPGDAVGFSVSGANGLQNLAADPESASPPVIRHGTGAVDQFYMVPVHLPDGALVTAAELTFDSVTNGGLNALKVSMVRAPRSGGGSPQSFKAGATTWDSPPDSGATQVFPLTVDDATVTTIDNTAYTYWLNITHTAVGASQHDWRAGRITYTLSTLRPA